MPGSTGDDRVPFLRPHPAALTSLVAQLAEIEASGVYTNFGPKNRLLEQRLGERLFDGEGRCVTCVNATTALMLAIRHEMAPQRRYALLPSFTFPASALAAVWNGLTPLFCDIDPRTWLPSEASEVALLDDRRDEIAVMIPQATFGNCLDLDRYADLARFYDVPVVVDAAPTIGSRDVDGRQFGTSSPFPIVFSMHATKTFATDEGGFVYADRPGLVEDLRSMTNFGFGSARQTTMLGLNGKLSELGALLALVKLDEIDEIVERRSAVATAYRRALPELTFQTIRRSSRAPVRTGARPRARSRDRDVLVDRVDGLGVEVAHYFSPHLAEQPYFSSASDAGDLSTTELVAGGILSLPMHDAMTTDDVATVDRPRSDGAPIGGRVLFLEDRIRDDPGLNQLAIGGGDRVDIATTAHDAVVEPDREVAHVLHEEEAVGDEDDRSSLLGELADAFLAPLLERLVADREHFVDDQDVGFDGGGEGERQPGPHPRGVRLGRRIHEPLDPGELDDVVVPGADVLLRVSHEHAAQEDVLATGEVGMEPDPELEHRRDRAGDVHRAPVGCEHLVDDPQERRLARPVRADDAEARPHGDDEVDALEAHIVS